MKELRSNFSEGTSRWAVRRAQWLALGLTDEDMRKPKIAIVNSSSDLASCFSHLDAIVPVLKEAVRAAGGVPFEIRTAAPADFITSAGAGGRYILPSRDLIVNDIEIAVEGAQLDGMVCLASCDKTAPAHVMAAARLDIPTVVVPCGYQRNALSEDGGDDIEEVFRYAGHTALGRTSVEDLTERSQTAIRGPGVCVGLGTANSMHIACEALGMTLPGTTPVRADSPRMWQAVRDAGKAVVELVENDVRPRSVLTEAAVENAVTVMLAIGGSVNSVKHLQAIAVEAGLDLDVWELYERKASDVPLLCAVRPNGPFLTEQLEDAGGARAVMGELGGLLDTSATTVTRRSVAANLAERPATDHTVIRPLDDPFARLPSLLVMRGSLAPEGAIVKLPASDDRPAGFTGVARIFHSREEGIAALAAGRIEPGDVIVLRGIGLKGGPGMGMASALVFALDGAGLGAQVAVVTDGQLSGLVNKGIVVGEVSPEAAVGGPLAYVEEGDRVVIDLVARTVDLDVDRHTLESRVPMDPTAGSIDTAGYLSQYRGCVDSLRCGAVLTGSGSCQVAEVAE
ncbi:MULTISPECIES: dihydroxy-acid dehydratase [unclassified Streptomyces]|uniref:dihydroxy-acid dehydratase n=1 Tax=unclassified Streptomyces TaxID=2593676 RepID=UPI0004B72F39|nr:MULTISPECIES: dihydroxy-acid dehydratase [unclassified Streptomyces]SCD58453.1 dihydroxyacid dehydratase [Streptomyces sp. PpalLS-921]SCE31555.1 dihydroxyacid dehydratase [Streptomyces sp. DpondAA-D4]